ncbi:MAG: fibronectin type III domain-containing protein, partial [Paracoccaceae bacterium]|nr:fibronectin type III domain-containing protein [Paracoccaceae bacterium]
QDLTVTPGDQKLVLSWTAVRGATGYDVYYLSVSADSGWMQVNRSGAGTSQEITGLTNGETYQVRLAARSGDVASDWKHGTGTPSAQAKPAKPAGLSPAAWLARFGRTAAGQAVDAVKGRLEGGGASHVTLGGQLVSLDTPQGRADATAEIDAVAAALGAAPGERWDRDGWMRNGKAPAVSARTMTGRELLLGSAFHLASQGEGSGPAFAAWGQVATGGFDGEAYGVRLDGDVTTGFLGADVAGERWLAGAAVAASRGKGTFTSSGTAVGEGEIESTVTSVLPYARLRLNERVTAWGLAGTGRGRLVLTDDERLEADLAMSLAAAGGRGTLIPAPEGGGFELALRTDALWVRTKTDAARSDTGNLVAGDAKVTRLRLVLDASRVFALGAGTLTPSLEVGLRHDGGDAETGAGVEIGAGLGWADPASGVTAALRLRGLAAHESGTYREWGASGTLRIDPGTSGRGLSLMLAPSVGNASSGIGTLWSAADARGLAPGGTFEVGRRFDAEVGYGLALFGDRFTGTPHAGLSLSEGGREVRLGWRLAPATGGPGLGIGLDATRKESANDNAGPEHGIGLRVTARW